MTVWGGQSGHMQVGIDVLTSAYDTNSTSVTVTVNYYVRVVNWRYSDNQSLAWNGGTGAAGNVAYNISQASTGNLDQLVYTYSYTEGISYGGGPTRTFSASVSGAYDGSAPSLSLSWTAPARPANIPTSPGLSVDSVGASSARAVVTAADGRGAGVDAYETQISTSSGFGTVLQTAGGGTYTFTGLSAATTYYLRTRAHNAVGYSAYSGTVQFTTGATTPGLPTAFAVSNIAAQQVDTSWTAPASTGGSAITGYDVQYAKDSGFTQSVSLVNVAASPTTLTGLTPGVQYWARVRAVNGVGAGSWTASATFTTLTGTPTIVSPTAGSTATTGVGTVTVNVPGIGPSHTITVDFSLSSTFASGVKTFTYTPTGYSLDGNWPLTGTSVALNNGTWYVRAKVTNNSTGYVTPYSATVSFVEAHTPAGVIVSPAAGSTVKYQATNPFSWNFTDPAAPIDKQTAYQLVVENNGTGATIYDSGKLTLNSLTSQLYSVNVAVGAANKNTTLRWRIKVWDRDDQASAFSGYSLFTVSDAPVVTIVAPAPALPANSGAPTFSWTETIPSGGTQSGAVVTVYDSATNALVWTGTVYGAATSITPPILVLTNNKSYYFNLVVTDTKGLVTTVSSTFTTSYTAPAAVSYTVTAT